MLTAVVVSTHLGIQIDSGKRAHLVLLFSWSTVRTLVVGFDQHPADVVTVRSKRFQTRSMLTGADTVAFGFSRLASVTSHLNLLSFRRSREAEVL